MALLSGTIAATAQSDTTLSSEKIDTSFFEQQLQNVSSQFLGRRYRLSPLGEEKGIDKDPLIRFDVFDCTTYIETVIALAHTPHRARQDQIEMLNSIRYNDPTPDYQVRRHLPEFQWLPELIEQGILRDITREIAPNRVRTLSTTMSPSIWKRRKRRIVPHLPTNAVPDLDIEIPYIPTDSFNQAAKEIDEIAVLSIVRVKSNRIPVVITHQALFIPNNGYPVVRHATKKPYYRVIEESLPLFLARLKRQRKRPVLVLNVTDILPPTRHH